jgi:small subunit ribosomal protein S16
MPTTIRMSRAGAKKRPYYRIVVTNSRSPRDSKFIERIGTYNPLLAQGNDKRVVIDMERAKYWLSKGAQMSGRIHLFFNQAGLVSTKPALSVPRKSKKELKAVAENAGAPAAPAAAKPAAAVEAPAPEAAAPDAAAS